MDFDALRLTDKELFGPGVLGYPRNAADAQLAKALWGIQKWLEENGNLGSGSCCAAHALEDQLLAGGIPRN